MTSKETPTLADYQKIKYAFEIFLRRVKALGRKVNVVVLSHEQRIQSQDADGIARIITCPRLREAYLTSAEGMFDVLGRLSVSEKKETAGQRFISFSASPSMKCGDRLLKRKFCKAEDLIPKPKEEDGICN